MERFWASRWTCSVLKHKSVGNCWYLALLRETTENADVTETCEGKTSFSCPCLFALTGFSCIYFFEVGLSVVLLLDTFHTVLFLTFSSPPQSKQALSYWKQILILILFQHSPCSAWYSLTLFCLVLLSTGSTFFFKQIGLSLVSVIH